MRTLFLALSLSFALILPLAAPPAAASVCADPVCIGYTVISTDCRVGALAVNGVYVRDAIGLGGFLFGEVTWHYCNGGEYSGHTIGAFSVDWYDHTFNGARSCGFNVVLVSVPGDCAAAPPFLPVLV